MVKENYPLPWCDELNRPYWQVNILLISVKPGWAKYQAGKRMAELIPEIDTMKERYAYLRNDG